MSATPGSSHGSIAVVGSINFDLVVRTEHHPLPGETVLGGELLRSPGGKGANQAVAAARLGAATSIVGVVGDDAAGEELTIALSRAGVDLRYLHVAEGVTSGAALIVIDEAGENSIVVSPGANAHLTADLVREVAEAIAQASVVLLQLEVPLSSIGEAARLATGTVVLNPAPAQQLPRELLGRIDVLVPNRTELAVLAGMSQAPQTVTEVIRAADGLALVDRVVVTLGADGAVVVDHGEAIHVPAARIEVVDTTGAGDCFCGVLGVALAEGASLEQGVRRAVVAAGVAVTRRGAQAAMPTSSDLSLNT